MSSPKPLSPLNALLIVLITFQHYHITIHLLPDYTTVGKGTMSIRVYHNTESSSWLTLGIQHTFIMNSSYTGKKTEGDNKMWPLQLAKGNIVSTS